MKENTTIDKVLRYIKRKANTTEDGNEVVSRLHAELAAKAAFDGGRLSVIENIPSMKWIDGSSVIGNFEGAFYEVCIAPTHFGEYSIRYFYYSKSYVVFYEGEKISNDFKLLNDAKLFAENDYQNRIKKALGL